MDGPAQDAAAALEAMAISSAPDLKRSAIVRLATRKDVPFIVKLVRELADYERLRPACVATEEGLQESLFKGPPFQGPTVLMLESSLPPGPPEENIPPGPGETVEGIEGGQPQSSSECVDTGPGPRETFKDYVQELTLRGEIIDPDAATYKSTSGAGRTVVGFVLFFPNYSTFMARAGYYIEDLYVREPYRGQGYGTILLK